MARAGLLVAAVLGLSTCRPAPPVRRELASSDSSALLRVLPDQAPPFVAATPAQSGAGFFRRSYLRGDERVEVTVARIGGGFQAYQSWVANSLAYPQVELSLPPDRANGFFTCSDDERPVCDVHIQFRSGFHLEGMGNGHVPKAHLAALLAGLNLAALTESTELPL